jgi:site-specific recombinase XerD
MPQRPTASRRRRHTASGMDRPTASTARTPAVQPDEGPSVSSRAAGFGLRQAISDWLAGGKAEGWSPRTLDDRRMALGRFCWWLENEARVPLALRSVTPQIIRAFLTYAREPREEGRFGCRRSTTRRQARPATINAYYRILRAFLNWCLAEDLIETTPLKNVKSPKVPNDQIQPLSEEQVQSLVDTVRRTEAPERNAALIFLLVDTGLRASEVIRLRIEDVSRDTNCLTVVGKGNKKRRVYMATKTGRALWKYLEMDRRGASPDDPLFTSVGGTKSGEALAYTGLYGMVRKAGKAAGLPKELRVSPHTLRHTFAVNFLRGGGNLFELQQLMGHEDLTILRRYVAFADADLAEAHRSASPVARMRLK